MHKDNKAWLAVFFPNNTVVSQIASEDNLADPFTKGLAQKIFDQHVEGMGVRCIASWL